MGIINSLIEIDKQLFTFLNSLHTPLMDSVMTAVSNKFTFIPLYLIFIYTIFKTTRKKWIVLFSLLFIVGLTDITASQLAKPYFKRLRPCHDTSLKDVHIVNNHCGKQYGYFSSHASITYGIALFMGLLYQNKKKRFLLYLLLLWGSLVAYSRIYLGVHFPLDVITGAICGCVFSSLIFMLLKPKAI